MKRIILFFTGCFFALTLCGQSENTLPVMFEGVKAYVKDKVVQINWSNLTERDIRNYVVEHSVNGKDFTPLDYRLPVSNHDDKASYSVTDQMPKAGKNYYRIKVNVVTYGKTVYSRILAVETGPVKESFSVYPNPAVDKKITLSLKGMEQGSYLFQLLNISGQVVFQQNLVNQGTTTTEMLQLTDRVKSGVYTALLINEKSRRQQLLIVQ